MAHVAGCLWSVSVRLTRGDETWMPKGTTALTGEDVTCLSSDLLLSLIWIKIVWWRLGRLMNDTCWGWGQGWRREKTKGLWSGFMVQMNPEIYSQRQNNDRWTRDVPPKGRQGGGWGGGGNSAWWRSLLIWRLQLLTCWISWEERWVKKNGLQLQCRDLPRRQQPFATGGNSTNVNFE